jgi:hypothetical protein
MVRRLEQRGVVKAERDSNGSRLFDAEAVNVIRGYVESRGQRAGRPPASPRAALPADPALMDLMAKVQSVYPKGVFSVTNWITAEGTVRKLLAAGVSPGAVLAALRTYAAQCQARGHVGTAEVLSPAIYFHNLLESL